MLFNSEVSVVCVRSELLLVLEELAEEGLSISDLIAALSAVNFAPVGC